MALIHCSFFSEVLGISVAVQVILPDLQAPAGSLPEKVSTDPFPVLWLLHGAGGSHSSWNQYTSIGRYVYDRNLAVVMPNVHLSGYADMAHGGRYFTFITEELPRVMRSFFPLSSAREDNFIAGLSMGGAGAIKIGLACPDRYAAIGCLSAAAQIAPAKKEDRKKADPFWDNIMDCIIGERDIPDDLIGTEEDVLGNAGRIVEAGGPFPRIFHCIGRDDFLLEAAHATRDWFGAVPGNPFAYTYVEDEGAHTWSYWDAHIQDFLAFIEKKS